MAGLVKKQSQAGNKKIANGSAKQNGKSQQDVQQEESAEIESDDEELEFESDISDEELNSDDIEEEEDSEDVSVDDDEDGEEGSNLEADGSDASDAKEDDADEDDIDLDAIASLNFDEFVDAVNKDKKFDRKNTKKSTASSSKVVADEDEEDVQTDDSSDDEEVPQLVEPDDGIRLDIDEKDITTDVPTEDIKFHPDPQNSNEYEEDSSDEEDTRNTIGNVPLNWYDEYTHVGYDSEGRKLIKPKQGDKLDTFLARMEDPNFWRTVKDMQTGQKVILGDDDLNVINRLKDGKIPDVNFGEYEPWIDWFSREVMQTPLRATPLSKTSFLPSKIDEKKIAKLVRAIRKGRIQPAPKPSDEPQFYMLWESDDKAEDMRRIQDHVPAPKLRLPGNAESYNPPAEYLFDDQELAYWKSKDDEPWKRKYNFIPQKYPSLRKVPGYDKFIKERFERCLDLYLCPRTKKMRLTIKAEDLVPQLPNPKDLQPFPTVLSMVYKGHSDMVRSISLEPFGQYFASGSDDGTVKIWEVSTGRCLNTFVFGGTVRCVDWCPNKSLTLLAVAVDNDVVIINPGVGDKLKIEKTDALLLEAPQYGDYVPPEKVAAVVTWEPVDEEKRTKNIRLFIRHFKPVRQVTWHAKGDYFSSVMPEGQNRSVVIHQLSTRKSQLPLSRSKGLVQSVLFHPIRPFFFVATQRHVRIYDLVKQEMVKKLMTGSKWISSMAIHPGGDNVIIGGYDKKVSWFDLDLSTKPYQTLRHHTNAVRSVAYHKRYPLFASGSDDCSVIVCHGMVYNDLLQNPLIVPVKKLKGHSKQNDFGILNVIFHNLQPWVFSSGADMTIKLFT